MNKDEIFAAIVGAGSSGLAAAVVLGRRMQKRGIHKKILILEKQDSPGRKLLATGGGRCNLSNRNIQEHNFNGDMELIHHVLGAFTVDDTVSFFESMGLPLREDYTGRMYPYSERAKSVLDCLSMEIGRLGLEIHINRGVSSISRDKDKYLLETPQGEILAKNVILSCGTGASPNLGSSTFGFEAMKRLGISFIPPLPALTALKTAEHCALKGVRAKGRVSLVGDGHIIADSNGEIQFTDTGLSGICVFDLSRTVSEYLKYKSIGGTEYKKLTVSADLFPTYTFMELLNYLYGQKERIKSGPPEKLLFCALDRRLAHALTCRCHMDGLDISSLPKWALKKLASVLKDFSFTPVECTLQSAQVCSGGAGSESVDFRTMQVKNSKGLYITGELLNADGICGGFNLQWAWATGCIAGRSIDIDFA